MTRTQCMTIAAGEYVAEYGSELNDHGSRCGYSDSELAQMRAWLAPRGLTIEADDCGLRVVAEHDASTADEVQS